MQKKKKSQLYRRKYYNIKALGFASAAFFNVAWHLAQCPWINIPHTGNTTSPKAWSVHHSLNPKGALCHTSDRWFSADSPKQCFRGRGCEPWEWPIQQKAWSGCWSCALQLCQGCRICWKTSLQPLQISASDASNDHKPCFLLTAGVAGENEEKVPEGAGFSDQLSFHFNWIKQFLTQEENMDASTA